MSGRTKRKTYPNLKPSGIKWVGEIPAAWDVKPFKRIVTNPVLKGTAEVLPFVALEHIVSGEGQLVQGFEWLDKPADEYAMFWPGDVLFGKLRPYLRKYLRTHIHGCCPTELLVFRAVDESLVANYLFYLVQAARFIALACSLSYGVKMPRTSWEYLGPAYMMSPSLNEQQAIANFLDHQTAKIDTLIAKKTRQIELLKERRIALISHVVTKGLDPTVEMKDSGVVWLGVIPVGWKVLKLKHRAKIRYGLGQPPPESETGVPLIRATDIFDGAIRAGKMLHINKADVPDARSAELELHEIIVVRSGAYTGDSAIITQDFVGAIAGYDMVAKILIGIPRYFAWQLLSAQVRNFQFELYKLRAAQPHLNAEELGGITIVSPGNIEQQDIADFLDHQTAKIDTLIAKIQEHIGKLKEYRIALISAAVTGKIDVRHVGEQSIENAQGSLAAEPVA